MSFLCMNICMQLCAPRQSLLILLEPQRAKSFRPSFDFGESVEASGKTGLKLVQRLPKWGLQPGCLFVADLLGTLNCRF